MAIPNVPDHVAFGPPAVGGPDLTFGEVRALPRQGQVEALRRRFESRLIQQTKPLVDSGASPFPLGVMICVGMAAVGEAAFGDHPNDMGFPFKSFAELLHSTFRDSLPTAFKTALVARWPTDHRDPRVHALPITTGAQLFYQFFRNTMIHGYRARGVFLSEDSNDVVDVTLNPEGTMFVRPSWLWARYVEVAGNLLDEIVTPARPSPKRAKAEDYLERMLK